MTLDLSTIINQINDMVEGIDREEAARRMYALCTTVPRLPSYSRYTNPGGLGHHGVMSWTSNPIAVEPSTPAAP